MPIIFNVIAIIAGSVVGFLFRKKINPRIQQQLYYVFAAIMFMIGISLICKGGNSLVAVISILLGFLVGELLDIEGKLVKLSNRISKILPGSSGMVEGSDQLFVSALVLTAFSTVGFLGAVSAGMTGDFSILVTKAILDFSICIFMAIPVGLSLSFLSIPTGLLLALVYLLSSVAGASITEQMKLDFSLCGGIVQIVNGIKMIKGKDVPVANLLPALIIVFFISAIL